MLLLASPLFLASLMLSSFLFLTSLIISLTLLVSLLKQEFLLLLASCGLERPCCYWHHCCCRLICCHWYPCGFFAVVPTAAVIPAIVGVLLLVVTGIPDVVGPLLCCLPPFCPRRPCCCRSRWYWSIPALVSIPVVADFPNHLKTQGTHRKYR